MSSGTIPRVPRAVFDCMVYLQAAARETSPAAECFRRVQVGACHLYCSSTILAEVGEVLLRPGIRKRFPRLTPEVVAVFLGAVQRVTRIVPSVPPAFSLPRDPDDEPYTDLAIAIDADYLVTWNERHLTYLMRSDTPEGQEFCRRFPRLTILDPVSFFRAIDARTVPDEPASGL